MKPKMKYLEKSVISVMYRRNRTEWGGEEVNGRTEGGISNQKIYREKEGRSEQKIYRRKERRSEQKYTEGRKEGYGGEGRRAIFSVFMRDGPPPPPHTLNSNIEQILFVFPKWWNSGKSYCADLKNTREVNLTRQNQFVSLKPLKMPLSWWCPSKIQYTVKH
jgi:hypothetical protein